MANRRTPKSKYFWPAWKNRMRKTIRTLAYLILALVVQSKTVPQARAQAAAFAAMAPLEEYLMPKDAEIVLARSAAPPSIADDATVLVLGPEGYATAVEGKNGFLCYVERSWAQTTDNPEFWNPKMRAPNCFNRAAATTVAQIYLTKTRLVLAGKSKAEIAQAIAADLDRGKLPALAPGAMCYMMSKQQYLNERGQSWYPHLMFYAAGDVASSWGANLPGSPVMSSHNPEARVTVFMVVVHQWSDGTPGPN
jgi:hypothetical protein